MSMAILPEFQEELRNLGATRFFREAFSALVRVTNSLGATRDVINEGEAIIRQARRDAEEAQARAEAAERAMEAAEKALEAARNDHAAEAREAANRAEAEANRLRAALSQLCEAESAIEAWNFHIAELGSAIQAAEAKATLAEEAEREAVSMAEEKEARAEEVEAAAEARVVAAIKEFKESDRFADELAEANADAYLQGFHHARKKVARVLDLPRAMDIEPDQGSEGAPSDDEPVANP